MKLSLYALHVNLMVMTIVTLVSTNGYWDRRLAAICFALAVTSLLLYKVISDERATK